MEATFSVPHRYRFGCCECRPCKEQGDTLKPEPEARQTLIAVIGILTLFLFLVYLFAFGMASTGEWGGTHVRMPAPVMISESVSRKTARAANPGSLSRDEKALLAITLAILQNKPEMLLTLTESGRASHNQEKRLVAAGG